MKVVGKNHQNVMESSNPLHEHKLKFLPKSLYSFKHQGAGALAELQQPTACVCAPQIVYLQGSVSADRHERMKSE